MKSNTAERVATTVAEGLMSVLTEGGEAGDIVGESADFGAAVRSLCKSKWPKLWKEMDL